MFFVIGDTLAGALIGVVTALGVRAFVSPGMDMVLAMLLGMGIGMVVHLALGFVLSPILGMFQIMVPASLIGMYGGMLFGMRDAMAAGSRMIEQTVLVGALFGVVVVIGIDIYDLTLRGPVDAAE